MNKKQLYTMLHNGVVNIKFEKVSDGTIREMPCTLNEGLIPVSKLPKGDSTKNQSSDTIRVFALDKSDWRSFREENLISYSDGLTSVELNHVGGIQ
jgi:hypothetical protein